MKGAPASIPMATANRPLQKYLQWSDNIVAEGQAYIRRHFPDKKFIGIHLRNGPDWVMFKICNLVKNRKCFITVTIIFHKFTP